jgi:hypothetical protein
MKKLFIAMFLVPLLNAQEVFLECNHYKYPEDYNTINLHLMLDKQLVKLDDEYKQYTQGTDGRLSWREVKTYDTEAKTTYRVTYEIDRRDLTLRVLTSYNYPLENKSTLAIYYCIKIGTEF